MQIVEVFESFHGEANGHHQGRLVTFVRMAGCNLEPKCPYCDTPKALSPSSGKSVYFTVLLDRILKLNNKYICFTGGEPLLQFQELKDLLYILKGADYHISVETNGSFLIKEIAPHVESIVLDYKLHAPDKMVWENYPLLTPMDIIKFVIKDEKEFEQALEIKATIERISEALFAFSPCVPDLNPSKLAEFILGAKKLDRINGSNLLFSLQIHKIAEFE